MVKQSSILFCFLFVSSFGFSQIANPDFEEFTSLPDAFGQFSKVVGWTNAGSISSTPDFYHRHGMGDVDLPNSLGSYVEAFEGNAVVGFIAAGAEGSEKREYISTQFEEPLTVGKQYLLSFRLTNGIVSGNSYMGYGVDHLGLALTTSSPVQNNSDFLNLNPQFEINSVFYDREWKLIRFLFTADQAYTDLTLGIFKPDADLTFIQFEPQGDLAYYFVDDFFMRELPEDYDPSLASSSKGDSSFTEGETDEDSVLDDEGIQPFFIPNAFTPNDDGDNDFFIPVCDFDGSLDSYQFSIYSVWGELLFSTNELNEGWDGHFKGEVMNPGAYVWNICYSEYKKDLEIKRKYNGSVNLIR